MTTPSALPTSRGLGRRDWSYILRRARHGFVLHRGIDAAAGLTFFTTLAFFPTALSVVSAFALADNDSSATDDILAVVGEFVTTDTVDTLRNPLESLLTIDYPWLAFAIGIVLTVWSVSSYATAFGRAMNVVYEVGDGRRVILFRLLMMAVSVVITLGFGAIVVILLTTPRAAAVLGKAMGIDEPWIVLWNIGKWPVLAIIAFCLIALLYYATPNVRHSRARWVSWGALFAIVAWAIGTTGFAVYVLTVSTYDRVYGWIGGGIVLLVWFYLTNIVLIFGAEVDAELVRARQLAAGIEAEVRVQLPERSTVRTDRLAVIRERDEQRGKDIREKSGRERPL